MHPSRPGDPRRLGPYRVLGRLGQGGQGIVYLAAGPGGERVAVKVLTGGLDRSFVRELAAARQVAEFCTARVIAADLDHEPPYVASEYIDGPSLAAVAPLAGAALTRLAVATATALTAIHRAGVVHRDFKPDNVLMAPDGPRVIDFGIARLADSTTGGSGIVGTPRYMAPEQFGDGPVGAAADVFAWGCTVAYAANGRSPFGGDTIPAVIHRILTAEPDLGALTGPLRGIVARCLDKDPARRPTARQVLLTLLDETASGTPAGTAPQADDREGRGGRGGAERRTGRAAAREPAGGRGEPSITVTRRNLVLAGGVVGVGLALGVAWRRGTGAGNVTAEIPAREIAEEGAGKPAEEAAGGGSAQGTTAPSPQATGPAEPPPAKPQELAAALRAALAVEPMAGFTVKGGMSQSAFHIEADGVLAYDSSADHDVSGVDFDMTITAYGLEDRIVVIGDGDREGFYVNGRRTGTGGPDERDTLLGARLVTHISSVAVIAEIVALTRRVRGGGAERTYAGSLPASEAPHGLQRMLAEIAGGWKEEQLARSTLTWKLGLDDRDRPRTFEFSWRTTVDTAELASSWTTTYSGWRQGGGIVPP